MRRPTALVKYFPRSDTPQAAIISRSTSGMTRDDLQKRLGSTGRVSSPLLPLLQRSRRDAERGRELRLRQTTLETGSDYIVRLDPVRSAMASRFDVANGLQQFLTDITLGAACQQVFLTTSHRTS
jgi:hypothetical protein